jgi:hypothetical protein
VIIIAKIAVGHTDAATQAVMAGLVPAIHVLDESSK